MEREIAFKRGLWPFQIDIGAIRMVDTVRFHFSLLEPKID
jgi:hypothetical protein